VDIFFGVFISYFFKSFNLCKNFLNKFSELGEMGRSFCSGVNFMIWPIKLVNNSIKNSELGGPNSYFNNFSNRTLQNSYGVE
jgi:hypothetical protein